MTPTRPSMINFQVSPMVNAPINTPPFFPRGNCPLVSICCASRGRSHNLVEALESLIQNTAYVGQIEFILKLDEDDTETHRIVQDFHNKNQHIRIVALVSPRGNGYGDMHVFTDMMVNAAQGDWVFLFNDDARMKTKNWDTILSQACFPQLWHFAPEDLLMLTALTNDQKDSNEFVLVRRSLFHLLGHLSLSPYIDSWLYYVLTPLQAVVRFHGIEVEHYRDKLHDQTRQETNLLSVSDQFTSLEGMGPATLICADTMRILGHLQRKLNHAVTLDRPNKPGWWYWQGVGGRKPQHVFVSGADVGNYAGGSWRLRVGI